MKKVNFIILSVASVLLIGIVTLILLTVIPQNTPENVTSQQSHFTSNPNSSQENNESDGNNSNINTMTSQADIYTVKAYKGHIGVFLNNEAEPFKEINISLEGLPQADQDVLKEGIKANTQSQLQIILEDYIS